jgi:hypothetical protein
MILKFLVSLFLHQGTLMGRRISILCYTIYFSLLENSQFSTKHACVSVMVDLWALVLLNHLFRLLSIHEIGD